MNDRHPKDPRSNPNHRERGPKVMLRVTYPLLAEVTGLGVETLRRYVAMGKVDPTDLLSLARFLAGREKKSRPAT